MKAVTDPALLEQLESESINTRLKPVTDPDIISQLEQPEQSTWDKISGNVFDALVGIGGIGRNLPVSQETKKNIANVAEPTAKGIGMGLGGTAGTIAGSFAMRPQYGAMAGAGMGNAAGGVVADILKNQLTDYPIPPAKEQINKMGRDVMEGATWEGIGQVSIPVLKALSYPIRKTYGLVKSAFPHFTEEQARQQAAKELKPIMDRILSEEMLSQNVDDATKIEKELGTKFTLGQRSRSPEAILKERYLSRRYPEIGFEDQKQQDLILKSINQYYNKQFPGKVGAEELINTVNKQGNYYDDLIKQALGEQSEEIAKLSTAKRPYDLGETIKKLRESEVSARRGIKNQLYSEVPDIEVPTDKLNQAVNDVEKFFKENPQYQQYKPSNVLDAIKKTIQLDIKQEKPNLILQAYNELKRETGFGNIPISRLQEKTGIPMKKLKNLLMQQSREGKAILSGGDWSLASAKERAGAIYFEGEKDSFGKKIPNLLIKFIQREPPSEKTKFQQLWGLRKPIYEGLRYSQDEPIARGQLERLKGAIESNLDDVLEMGGEAAEKYGKAAKYYKESYKPLYEGVTGEIGRVNRYGDPRVKLENIPGRIFNDVSNAKQFMESIGQNQSAKDSMRDYISHEILNNPTIYNSQTNSINSKAYGNWFRQNKDILDQLGQSKNFTNLGQVAEKVAEVEAKSGEFAKSIASRAIGSDVNKVIENIFSGATKKKSAQTMWQLVTELKKIPDGETAIKGLKQAFADYYKTYFEISPTSISGQPLNSIARHKIFMKEYRPALSILYKGEPEKIKALETIRNAYEIMRRNQSTPFVGGGSPTAEHILQALPRQITARIYKFIPLVGGSISTNIEQFNRKAVDELIYKALYDPETAYTLIYGHKLKPQAFAGRLKGHLIGMGLYNTFSNRKESNLEEKRQKEE